jgi:hypothetical protein
VKTAYSRVFSATCVSCAIVDESFARLLVKLGALLQVVRARVRGGPAGPLLGWLRHARPRHGLGRWAVWVAAGLLWFKVILNFIS